MYWLDDTCKVGWMDYIPKYLLFLITMYISYANPTTTTYPSHYLQPLISLFPPFLFLFHSLFIYHSYYLSLSLTHTLSFLPLSIFFLFSFLSFSLLDDMINQLEREERELINRLRKTQRLQEKVVGAH